MARNLGKTTDYFPIDNYDCSLSEELAKKALLELNEEPDIRQQAIDTMRQFINNQPQILKCRQDSNFLLRFLRVRKFKMPVAEESLLKYLELRQALPHIMQNLDIDNGITDQLLKRGTLLPLPVRDKRNRTILLVRPDMLEYYKHSGEDFLKLFILTLEILLEEEHNQIYGFVILSFLGDFTFSSARVWGLSTLKTFVLCRQKAMPLRNKGVYCIDAPWYAVVIVNIFKRLIVQKPSDQLHLLTGDNVDEYFSKDMLPKELGGETPLEKLIDDWRNTVKSKREMLLNLDEAFQIEMEDS